MKQIVALAAADIFKAIKGTPDREFLLKLTAFEIYNERVGHPSSQKQPLHGCVSTCVWCSVQQGQTASSSEHKNRVKKLCMTRKPLYRRPVLSAKRSSSF